MNRSNIALLLIGSAAYLGYGHREVAARSLVGLGQQLRQIDETDQTLLNAIKNEKVQVDLAQTLAEEIEADGKKTKSVKPAAKPVPKPAPKPVDPEQMDKFHRTGLIGNDNIAAASTEDMFAFSQVLASGQNVNKAVKQLEQVAVEQQQEEEIKKQEQLQQSIEAMKEANKSPLEKYIAQKKQELHQMAQNELDNLQNNEQTSALASLVDAQKLELLAEQMQGSGQSAEEQRKKKKEEEKKKRKAEEDKKRKKKQMLVQKKKQEKQKALERKKKIEDAFKKLKTEHGGINGTEDTGYDDSAMDAYVKRDDPVVLLQSDDIEVEEYENLLVEHRNHLLAEKINEDRQYIEFV